MKMKRATYRHIEAEIYSYNDTLKAIEELLVRKHKVTRKEEERVEIEIREFKEVG